MAREYEGYREQIERLNAMFPGRTTIKAREVAEKEGWKDLRTVKKKYQFDDTGSISIEAYARALCRRFPVGGCR